MKHLIMLLVLSSFLTGCKNDTTSKDAELEKGTVAEAAEKVEKERDSIEVIPISHATSVIKWGDVVFYTDPTGGAEAFRGKEKPDFVLITDIHGDHMDAKTLKALELKTIKIIVPQAVKDALPQELHSQLVILNNGESQEFMGFDIQAVPMYNLPEDPESRHIKGRGNGYVLEKNNTRIYIAGDTEDIPEMRELKNIDIAFIPMNLPYTMDIEQAAEGVLAFAPKKVYPYHYRGQNGLADVEKFKELVNAKNKNIEVVLLNWYPGNNN